MEFVAEPCVFLNGLERQYIFYDEETFSILKPGPNASFTFSGCAASGLVERLLDFKQQSVEALLQVSRLQAEVSYS
jgi:hypothetical protein